MRGYVFLFAFLLFAGIPEQGRAESLDDKSIQKVYAEPWAMRAAGDADGIQQLMESRLDEQFALITHNAQKVGSERPQTSTEKFDKPHAIEAAMRGLNRTQMESYEQKVTGIKYSADKKYAYVTDTASSSGTLDIPVEGQGHTRARYFAEETCSDVITLAGDKIRFLKSECSNQLMVTK